MKKYELKLQLQKQMEELNVKEQQDRKTVEQLCTEWNWTLSDKEATIVTNEIVINKGKIIEIPVVKYETKEVVVDNTDTETIEMLRETIRQMNQTINDMNKEHDELYKLYLEEQREKVIWAAAHDELKEVYEQQMIDMTSEFELQLDELNRKYSELDSENEQLDREIHVLTGQVAGYEAQLTNKDIKIESLEKQIADVKEDKVRAEIIKIKSGATIEVVDDHTYDNEPEPEEEVVNEVEEIIVPTTKEEKPVSNAPYSISIKTTHDAVKAEITIGDKVFYTAWSVEYNKPAYALVDNHKQYTRKDLRQIGLGIAYKYDKQITADLKPHRDKLLEELEAKRNKNNNRKPEPQVTKENTIETPEEIEVPITNDTANIQTNEETIETDDKWADIDNAEFF